ncbi:MAG: hypothetical protein A2428_00930 [Bdellovibrionales bacterium RIFOXYC1_FULL_54_43]|nr:MAG: hypothetical protein A2428_00930 [Bdellovibrionales bacterium RIFOXYC1_FULL_54_43]OFZ82849.1 MAG: hypothetical protein A2603_11655 [Bdellovibrionales bacterium RIFOXYD1_FULL_55_31]
MVTRLRKLGATIRAIAVGAVNVISGILLVNMVIITAIAVFNLLSLAPLLPAAAADVYAESTACTKVKFIKQVGGCNALGLCNVEFSDGTFGRSNKAVRGNAVCVKRGSWFGDFFLGT